MFCKTSKNYATKYFQVQFEPKVQSFKPSQLAHNSCNLLRQACVALTKLLWALKIRISIGIVAVGFEDSYFIHFAE